MKGEPEIITRAEAKVLGLKRYFTGKPCPRGHVVERRVCGGHCVECDVETNRKWREANPERMAELGRKWYEDNKERKAENNRKWYEENKERSAETNRKWREANPERMAETSRKWREENKEWAAALSRKWREANPERMAELGRIWRKANPDKVNASNARRRARELTAEVPLTPEEEERILALFTERDRLTEETGELHHVDHVISLAEGGPHHPDNMWVVTAEFNLEKGRKSALEFMKS